MLFKINVHFRRFNGPREDEDSGYYNSYDGKRTCRIDVNLDDDPFEQALTIFHEVTHMVFDLFCQYEMDNDKQQVNKRDHKLHNLWRVYNKKIEKRRKDGQSREELICCWVEDAVRVVLLKKIPKKFLEKLFTSKKKKGIIHRRKRGHRHGKTTLHHM